jgi:hypothetical protein
MEIAEVWKRILKYRGETFLLKRGKAFTYSQGEYGHMYVDTVKLSFPLTVKEFEKALKVGKKDRLVDYTHVVAKSYVFSILKDERIGAWK